MNEGGLSSVPGPIRPLLSVDGGLNRFGANATEREPVLP